MAVFVRKIDWAKWEQAVDLVEGEISADAITGDLRTTKNKLSFWSCPTAEAPELERAALAIATARDQLDRIDLVYLDDASIRENGLATMMTPGNTPVPSLRDMHVDIHGLDRVRLDRVAGLVAGAHRSNAGLKLSQLRLLSVIVDAVQQGLVEVDSLRGDLRMKVAAELGRI